MKPSVYLDLDRTLFRTNETYQIWDEIGRLYPQIDAAEQYQKRLDYHLYVGDLYYCDMARHLRDIGLVPEEVYERLAGGRLYDGRFEFEGVSELITALADKTDLRIFTFGTDDYQRFKASLCPSLFNIPIVATLRPKAELLIDLNTSCWLIDDKPIGHELPPHVEFVQVNLEGMPLIDTDSWPIFTTLPELTEYLVANVPMSQD